MMALDTISMAAGSSRRCSLAPSGNVTSNQEVPYHQLVARVRQLEAKMEKVPKGNYRITVSNLMIQAVLYHTDLS